MKHKRIIVIFVLLLFAGRYEMKSQLDFLPKGKSLLTLSAGDASSAGIYDMNEVQRSELLIPQTSEDSPQKKYTFMFDRYDFKLGYQYTISDDCLIKFEIPTAYYTLTKKTDTTYLVDDGTGNKQSVTQRYNYVDASRFRIEHITIGADYRLWNKKSFFVLSTALLIPTVLKDDNGNKDFLGNNSLELLAGFYFGAQKEHFFYQTEIFYNYRNGDRKDCFFMDMRAALSTIEGTWLGLNFIYLQSLSSFKSAVPVDPQSMILQENKIRAGAFFRMELGKAYFGEFNYLVDMSGRNTLKLGEASLKLATHF